jgi:hypothetical protein
MDGGNVVRKGEVRNVYKILVGKPERKRPHNYDKFPNR